MFAKSIISLSVALLSSGAVLAADPFFADADPTITSGSGTVPSNVKPKVQKPEKSVQPEGQKPSVDPQKGQLETVTTVVSASPSPQQKPINQSAQSLAQGQKTAPVASVSTMGAQAQSPETATALPTPYAVMQAAMAERASQKKSDNSDDGSITVRPGETQTIQISNRALNRFVTPFRTVKIQTIDNIDAIVDKGTVYISSQSPSPIGVYLVDQETMEAISLELIPAQIPLREITLKLDPSYRPTVRSMAANSQMEKQRTEPYVVNIADYLKEVALGHVPAGFNLTNRTDPDVNCFMPGLEFKKEQLLVGSEERISVLVAENKTETPLEISEQGCYSRGVEAVAAYPRVLLQPGEKTEVYVIKRNLRQAEAPVPERKILVR